MCAINLELDNSLMERFRHSFDSQERLSAWMSSQMELLMKRFLDNPSCIDRKNGLSDEELDRLFCGRPDFNEASISELTHGFVVE